MTIIRSRGGKAEAALAFFVVAIVAFIGSLYVSGQSFPAQGGGTNPIKLRELSANPASSTNAGTIYTKEVAGITELYYRDSAGNVRQMTPPGAGGAGTLSDIYIDGAKVMDNAADLDFLTDFTFSSTTATHARFSIAPALANKVSSSTAVNTTYPLEGGGDLTTSRTLTVVGATTASAGTITLAGDLGGTYTSPTVPDLVNKVSSATNLNATYPLRIAGGETANLQADRTVTITSATTASAGSIVLTGDLGGTGASPTVLAVTSSGTSFTAGTGANGWVSGKYLYVDGSSIVASATAAGAGSVTASGTSGQVAYFDGTSSLTSETNKLYWDSTNDVLSVGGAPFVTGASLNVVAKASDGTIMFGTSTVDALLAVRSTSAVSTENAVLLAQQNNAAGGDAYVRVNANASNWVAGINRSQGNSYWIQPTSVMTDGTNPVSISNTANPRLAISDFANDTTHSLHVLTGDTTDIGALIYNSKNLTGNRCPLFILADNGSGTMSNISIEARTLLNANAEMVFRTGGTGTSYTPTFGTEAMRIDNAQNIQLGPAGAAASTATDGFPFIRTTTASPTGVPTAITGFAPLIYDSSTNIPWIYSGGAWKQPKADLVTGVVTWQ